MSGRRFWFLRLAACLRLPPVAFAALLALLISALTLGVERLAGPVEYPRKPFETFAPHLIGLNLPVFVALLLLAERWASRALEGLHPFLHTDLDPTVHPPVVSWGGAAITIPVTAVVQEINAARWSRLLAGDWNLFDAWTAFVVIATVVVCYQVALAVFLLAWRIGQLATASIDLDLFDPRRGQPFVGLALRLALTVAVIGISIAVAGVAGAWALWSSLFFASFNLASCVLLVSLCIHPFVRAMRSLKNTELARVQAAIAGDSKALAGSPLASRLAGLDFGGLLLYRREVMAASAWPLDALQWGRLLLYLLLPPLSWVAAAFVEEWVQRAIAG